MSRILAIDDAPLIRQLVTITLQEDGHQVTTAANGQEGLDAARAQKFDLIITDFNMPVMNGLTFISSLRKHDRFTPVLVLTTEVSAKLKESAKAAGASGWLVKPFSADTLKSTARRLL